MSVSPTDLSSTITTVAADGTLWVHEIGGRMTDEELGELIGIKPGEDQATAIRRYVRETQDHYGSIVSRAEAAEQELQRVRKLLNKALGIMQ